MPPIKVAIAGFTGRFARLLTAELLKKPDVIIHGIARDPSKIPQEFSTNSRVKIFQAGAFDSEALQAAVRGVDVCVCCYRGDFSLLMTNGQKLLIDICIDEKVSRYIASDYTFDYRKLKLGDHPAKDFSIVIHEYLAQKEKAGLIKPVHVFNGLLMEIFWTEFFDVFDEKTATFWYWGTGDETWDMTTFSSSAKFVAEVACDNNATGVLNVVGDRKSVKEIAALYEQVFGEKAHLEYRGTLDELYKTAKDALHSDPQDLFGWIPPHFHYYITNGATTMGQADNGRYPTFHAQSLREYLQSHDKSELAASSFF